MSNPFFSIILPTYNRAKFVPDAVRTVVEQVFQDWELIIVDDGSTDGTGSLFEKINDPRISYFYQQNRERSIARNNGIDKAKGRYICFLDSDDLYDKDHLIFLHDAIVSSGFKIAFFYSLRAFEKDGRITYPPLNIRKSVNNIELIFNIMIATPQACIHRDILVNHRFDPRFKTGEDIELWSRILIEYPLVKVNHYTVISKIHDDNSVNFSSGNFFKENLMVVRHIFENKEIARFISFGQKHHSLSNCHFGIARYHLSVGEKAQAVKNLCRSIIVMPWHEQTLYRLRLILKTIFKP